MSEVPKKSTWVEMLEKSIEELKNEYDAKFKKLEEDLKKNIVVQSLDLTWAVFLLMPEKSEKNLDLYLNSVKDLLERSKDLGTAVFKDEKELNNIVGLAKSAYNIESFDNLIKKLSARFSMQLIKESMTIEIVTEYYGVEGARIFKTL